MYKNTLYYNLLSIKGIGPHTAKRILIKLGVNVFTTFQEIPISIKDKYNKELTKIRRLSQPNEEYNPIENNLDKYNNLFLHGLILNRSYRGSRLRVGLPSRGQRTRSNACTAYRLRRFKK